MIMEAAAVKLARARALLEAAAVKLASAGSGGGGGGEAGEGTGGGGGGSSGEAGGSSNHRTSPLLTYHNNPNRTLRDTAVPTLMVTSYGQAPVCMSNVTTNLKLLFIIGMISLSRQNSRKTTSLQMLQM